MLYAAAPAASRISLPAVFTLDLYAAASRVDAVCPAHRPRLRTHRERRSRESRPVSTSGADQNPDRLFPRRIFRAQVGLAARFAHPPPALVESAALLPGPAGDAGH